MKIFFFIALLINIIFFLWEFNSGGLNAVLPVSKAVNNDTKQIVLLSELPKNGLKQSLNFADNTMDSQQQVFMEDKGSKDNKSEPKVSRENTEELIIADQTSNVTRELKADKTICYQVGPFKSQVALTTWRKANKINAESFIQFNKDRNIDMRYLVYYPAAENRAKTKENIQMIKGMNVTDYWLFRKGEMKGAISLGLFANEKSALILQRNLSKRGLELKTKQFYQTVSLLYAQLFSTDARLKESLKLNDNQQITDCESQ